MGRLAGDAGDQQVEHAPTTLLIPGTRSRAHLEVNVGAGNVALGADAVARLDAVSTPNSAPHPHGVESFRPA